MSLCTLEPFTNSVPLDCNLVVYQQATTTDLPVVTIRRDDVEMAIDAQVISSTPMTLDVYSSGTCDGETVRDVTPTDYTVLELSLPGVAVGDQLFVNGFGKGEIFEAASACPTPYAPECNDPNKFDCAAHEGGGSNDGGGCNAAPSSSLVLLPLVVALLIRRRHFTRYA